VLPIDATELGGKCIGFAVEAKYWKGSWCGT